jgi:hypothetical protein
MATSTILGISTTVTAPRLDDSVELQSVAAGSAQITVANLIGTILAKGNTTITSPSSQTIAVSFGGTVAAVPTRIYLTIYCLSSSATVVFGNVISGSITNTGFSVQLSGPTGDATHIISWTAYT